VWIVWNSQDLLLNRFVQVIETPSSLNAQLLLLHFALLELHYLHELPLQEMVTRGQWVLNFERAINARRFLYNLQIWHKVWVVLLLNLTWAVVFTNPGHHLQQGFWHIARDFNFAEITSTFYLTLVEPKRLQTKHTEAAESKAKTGPVHLEHKWCLHGLEHVVSYNVLGCGRHLA
jgi:hypothetical protein